MTTDVAGPAVEEGSVIQRMHRQRAPVIFNKMHRGWIGGSLGSQHNEMLYSLMFVFPTRLPETVSRESLGISSTFSICRNKDIITLWASGELTEAEGPVHLSPDVPCTKATWCKISLQGP